MYQIIVKQEMINKYFSKLLRCIKHYSLSKDIFYQQIDKVDYFSNNCEVIVHNLQ